MAQAPLLAETSRLRTIFRQGSTRGYVFTKHARIEMAKDKIIASDIELVCAQGVVTWIEWKLDEIWHVEGRDLDGRSIRVVITLLSDEEPAAIKVITAMLLR